MIDVNSLMDSLRVVGSRGSSGVTGIGGLLLQEYLEVFPYSSRSSSSKAGSSVHWEASSGVSGSGEGLSIGMTDSATVEETSSKTGSGSNQMGSSGGVFSKI
jgi:hypothetical protein